MGAKQALSQLSHSYGRINRIGEDGERSGPDFLINIFKEWGPILGQAGRAVPPTWLRDPTWSSSCEIHQIFYSAKFFWSNSCKTLLLLLKGPAWQLCTRSRFFSDKSCLRFKTRVLQVESWSVSTRPIWLTHPMEVKLSRSSWISDSRTFIYIQ